MNIGPFEEYFFNEQVKCRQILLRYARNTGYRPLLIMEIFKQYGLPRTGTNTLNVLINKNFQDVHVLTNKPDFKHGYNTLTSRKFYDDEAKIGTEHLQYLVSVKNPYSWLYSYYKYEVSRRGLRKSFEEYVLGNDNYYHKDKNPVSVYNEFNNHWLNMSDDAFFVKSEDLETPDLQEKTLAEIQEQFQLEAVGAWETITRRVLPGEKVSWLRKFKPNNYLEHFTPGLIKATNNRLDNTLLKKLGYSIINQ